MWAQEAQEEQAALLLATKGIVGIQGKASKNYQKSIVYLPPQIALSLFSYLQLLLESSSTFLLVSIPLLADSRPPSP